MQSKLFSAKFIFVSVVILLAALSRVLPHIPNFTPIAAMALFGAVNFSDKRLAFIIPMLAMILSDVAIEFIFGWGFHNTIVYVYASFILTSCIGLYVRKHNNLKTIVAGSLAASILFFGITNFGVWAANGFVGGSAGLAGVYTLGLPYFSYTLLGDLFYNAILFGSLYFAQRNILALIKA